MIEKKTTKEIAEITFNINKKSDGKQIGKDLSELKELIQHLNKIWISEDSLIEELNYDLKIIMSNTDKKKKEFISTYIKLLIKQLESVKK